MNSLQGPWLAAHNVDLVSQNQGFIHIVGDEQGRPAHLLLVVEEPLMQLASGHRIQGPKGLIQEDPLALEAGCPQEGGSLAHTPDRDLG